ncbi:MAG: DUF374 domain-containing protein [Planctomycetota bacterium]
MKIRSRTLNRLLARLIGLGLRTLYRTCRFEMVFAVPEASPYDNTTGERFLYCIWHEHLATVIAARPAPAMSGIVSAHRDGGYVADVMEQFDILPVRGSSTRRGAVALIKAIRNTSDRHLAITPDGPRGPRRSIAPGIVFLAAKTGRRIVPVSIHAVSPWTIKGSWTDLSLSRPFGTVRVAGGAPLSVPASLKKGEIDTHVARVAAGMDLSERVARGELTPAEAWPHQDATAQAA